MSQVVPVQPNEFRLERRVSGSGTVRRTNTARLQDLMCIGTSAE